MAPSAGDADRDARLGRYAVCWMGAQLASRVRQIALLHGAPVPGELVDVEGALLAGAGALSS